MARPRKIDTDEMLKIVDSYFENNGDPDKLKCSYLEEYAVSLGIAVKAYDFRRNTTVRQRMEELRDLSLLRSDSSSIAYKNLDVDAFLTRNRTKQMLRNSLFELDETWRRIYERATQQSKKNEALKSAAKQAAVRQEALIAENAELFEQVKALKKENRDVTLENRYLKKMLKTYLYPAIANEILLGENVLEQADTQVTQAAMVNMVDPLLPSPFSNSVASDKEILSREELLMERMKKQISKALDDD